MPGTYFNNFPTIGYNFGNEITTNIAHDLTVYVDLIDQLKDNGTTYETYSILDGDRPDHVSYKIYGDTSFYWTFYYLNDKLRRQGWPLSYRELTARVKKIYAVYVTYKSDEALTGLFHIRRDGATHVERYRSQSISY